MNRRRSYDLGYTAGLREARRILAESAGCREFGTDEIGAFIAELERLREDNPYIARDGERYVFPLGEKGDNTFRGWGDEYCFRGATVCDGVVTIKYDLFGPTESVLPIRREHHDYSGRNGMRSLLNVLANADARLVEKVERGNRNMLYLLKGADGGFEGLDMDLADELVYADVVGGWLCGRFDHKGADVLVRAKVEP